MGRGAFNFDWLIFIPALLLVIFGIITLLSIEPQFFYQQLFFAVLALILFWIFTKIDFQLYHYLDRYIYAGSILLLLLSFLGPDVRGATRWLEFGSFRFQPSEIVKPFLMVSFASLLVRYPPIKPRAILMHTCLFLIPFILVFIQPDLGNAIVYSFIWGTMLLIAGMPIGYFVAMIASMTAIAPLGYRFLHEYQKLRILTFINPLTDPSGAGYNTIQSIIAVGSGRLFGRGFGRGTQSQLQFLPERHTDFIFASFNEEFGMIGGLLLIAIFFVLLIRLLKLSQRMNTSFASLFVTGIFAQILVQVVINIGMNIGIVPITGITLPFVSYGRSSLFSLWLSLGMVFAAYGSDKKLSSSIVNRR